MEHVHIFVWVLQAAERCCPDQPQQHTAPGSLFQRGSDCCSHRSRHLSRTQRQLFHAGQHLRGNDRLFVVADYRWPDFLVDWDKVLWCRIWVKHSTPFLHENLPSVKDRGHTDSIDFDLQSRLAVVMAHTHAQNFKFEVQSVQKKEWKETDGRMDMTDCITFPANKVGNIMVGDYEGLP